MALPATDAFTGSDGTVLTTYSANWTLNSGNFYIQINSIAPDGDGLENGAGWNADTFDNDQYATGTIVEEFSSAYAIGVSVRCKTDGTANYYGFYSASDASYVFKMVTGSWTQLGNNGAAFVAADVMKLEVDGSQLTAYKNGSPLSLSIGTDTAHASGRAGLSGYGYHYDCRLDNWSGGNLAAPAGRTTKNTDARPLGMFAGISRRMGNFS